MTFFDILKAILTKNRSLDSMLEDPEFDRMFSSFMLARYLSMRSDLIGYARVINHMQSTSLSKQAIFKFAYDAIPKQRSGYIQYMKKAKKDKKARSN